jgi:hypothetical protein
LLAWDTLADYGVCANWAERLKRRQAESAERELRRATLAGKPFADAPFRCELERKFERDLEWRPRGRSQQPKTAAAAAGRVRL